MNKKFWMAGFLVIPKVYAVIASPFTFMVGTFSWQDPVHSWKAGPGEGMTVEKKTNTMTLATFTNFNRVRAFEK